MSIVTSVEYVDSYRVKHRYMEDDFTGYRIITSDDVPNEILQKNREDECLRLQTILDNLYIEYTEVDLINEIEEKIKILREGSASKTYSESLHSDTFKNIMIMIDNHQSCCEKFGVDVHCPANKNINSLSGAVIKSVKYGNVGQCVIDLDTNVGLFKFIIYNEHDGYYPHNYYFSFNDYYSWGKI